MITFKIADAVREIATGISKWEAIAPTLFVPLDKYADAVQMCSPRDIRGREHQLAIGAAIHAGLTEQPFDKARQDALRKGFPEGHRAALLAGRYIWEHERLARLADRANAQRRAAA